MEAQTTIKSLAELEAQRQAENTAASRANWEQLLAAADRDLHPELFLCIPREMPDGFDRKTDSYELYSSLPDHLPIRFYFRNYKDGGWKLRANSQYRVMTGVRNGVDCPDLGEALLHARRWFAVAVEHRVEEAAREAQAAEQERLQEQQAQAFERDEMERKVAAWWDGLNSSTRIGLKGLTRQWSDLREEARAEVIAYYQKFAPESLATPAPDPTPAEILAEALVNFIRETVANSIY